MRIIKMEIENAGGKFVVKHKPQIIGEDSTVVEEIDVVHSDDSEDSQEDE